MISTKLWLTQYKLTSKSVQTRLLAVRKLREVPGESSVKLLIEALKDSEPAVRSEAAAALGSMKDGSAIDPLIEALKDSAVGTQEAAIQALQRIGDPSAMAALATCLMRGAAGVKCRAARALKIMGWSPRNQEEEIQFCVSAGEWQRVTLLGKAAVPAIAAVLKHGANEERVSAANALGALNEPAVLQSLVDALGDSEALVRTAALNGIAELGDARAVARIIGVLKDHDKNVRSAAAMALGELGDLQAVDYLIPMLGDAHWEARAAAMQSLGRLGDRRALEPILGMLQDKDAEIRQQAADALGRLGDPSVVEKLVLTMMDSEMGVRNAASRALTMIEPYWERTEVVHALIPQIEACVRNKDVSIQYAATMLLRRISVPVGPGAAPAPQRIEMSRPAGTPVGLILQSLLADPDPDVRLAAVESLGRMKSPEAAAALRPALNDSNDWVRFAANSAMSELAA